VKSIILDYFSLTKPRLASLNVIAAMSGILMSRSVNTLDFHFEVISYVAVLIAGAGALNCAWEVKSDLLMERTKMRAIPAGRISVASGVTFGLLLVCLGLIGLFFRVNTLSFLLGFISVLSYVLLYTPLKRKTHLAVYAGAIPGALPPVLGYTAVVGSFDSMAVTLFLILFFWQIPHFLAISIYQADDYQNGGIIVYPNAKGIEITKNRMVLFSYLTCLTSTIPYFLGFSNKLFLLLGLLLGIFFIYFNSTKITHILDSKIELHKWAKKCFFASIIYLPLLFGVMVVF